MVHFRGPDTLPVQLSGPGSGNCRTVGRMFSEEIRLSCRKKVSCVSVHSIYKIVSTLRFLEQEWQIKVTKSALSSATNYRAMHHKIDEQKAGN